MLESLMKWELHQGHGKTLIIVLILQTQGKFIILPLRVNLKL